MSKKIFVGGLKWGIDSELLRKEFERFGNIEEATVVRDRETGRSKGFGFVTFEDDNCAQQAISEMNGKEIDGRIVKVDYAQTRPKNDDFQGRRQFN